MSKARDLELTQMIRPSGVRTVLTAVHPDGSLKKLGSSAESERAMANRARAVPTGSQVLIGLEVQCLQGLLVISSL